MGEGRQASRGREREQSREQSSPGGGNSISKGLEVGKWRRAPGDAWAVLMRVAGAGLWITQERSRQVSRGDVSGASEGIQRDVTRCH